MNRLKDKRALISGGTSGIGLETAKLFLQEGARVAITGRNADNLEAARKELGADVLTIATDAGKASDQKAVAAAIGEKFGALDILFINAGVADLKPLEKWDEEAFDRSFATNIKGPFFLVQALLPIFASPASIVLNTSINAHIGMANTTVYAATKAALLSLARTLSGELMPRGIRVNAVSPGPIWTPMQHSANPSADELKAANDFVTKLVPAGRFGTASEIAHAVVFLASDESAFTIGSELLITGGMGNI